jgi:hypothetical protein
VRSAIFIHEICHRGVSISVVAGRLSGVRKHFNRTLEDAMKYLCLIYDNEKAWETVSKEEAGAIFGEYGALTKDLQNSGHYLGGNPLQPTSTATTVRVRQGKVSTTDGPFAETKEQLGGYYLVEAKDLNEAIKLAARIPSVRTGSIEVRPIMDVGMSAAG